MIKSEVMNEPCQIVNPMSGIDALCIKLYKEKSAKMQDDNIEQLFKMLTIRENEPVTMKFAGQLFNKANSLAQSSRCKNGRLLEEIMEQLLKDVGITFLRQVSHNSDGLICKPKVGHSVHDIVVNAKLGDKLSEKTIISCKTSVRERYKQDGDLPAKKVYMVTFDRLSPRTIENYQKKNMHMVCIGKDGALDKMFEDLLLE
jgi:hypothetical protein